MKRRYAIAFCPPPHIVELVRGLKLELSSLVGWFPSLNSEAHFTVCTFDATEEELQSAITLLVSFCANQAPYDITLDSIRNYSHEGNSKHVLYLAPDSLSEKLLSRTMKYFNRNFGNDQVDKTQQPHLTIARGLTASQLEKALDLFGNRKFDFLFTCDNLALREFDAGRKQYFVRKRFFFGSLTLF